MNKKELYKFATYCEFAYNKSTQIKVTNDKLQLEYIEDKKTDTQLYIWTEVPSGRLIIAFRGTESPQDALEDVKAKKDEFLLSNGIKCKIHKGFLQCYLSVKPDIMKILNENKIMHIDVCGHSLGAAEATIAALDLQVCFPERTFSCYTIGSPRVGNKTFVNEFNKQIGRSFRTVNHCDPVTKVPLRLMGFRHVRGLNQIGSSWLSFWMAWRKSKMEILEYHYTKNYLKELMP